MAELEAVLSELTQYTESWMRASPSWRVWQRL